MNIISTEEYYIASMDLLGGKELILNDNNDDNLNQIKNIYQSWVRIKKEWDFSKLEVKIFSDNIIVAIKCEYNNAFDELLEFVADMAYHFLRCGYKIRGGICKGKLYIDALFVWGEGLVNAYLLESKKANYPRIILDPEVVFESSEHLSERMIVEDSDGEFYLNYLKSFGRNKMNWIDEITKISEWINIELEELLVEYDSRKEIIETKETKETKKKIDKMQWLKKYVNDNLIFWENYDNHTGIK